MSDPSMLGRPSCDEVVDAVEAEPAVVPAKPPKTYMGSISLGPPASPTSLAAAGATATLAEAKAATVRQESINASLTALYEAQARTINNLEVRLAKLEERFEMAPVDVAGTSQHLVLLETAAIGDNEECGNTYKFSVSMWDAAMLWGLRETDVVDKVIIFFGIVMNWALQILLLLVVALDMLHSEFNDERIQNLMTWRAEQGHDVERLDRQTGATLVERLCNQSLWSFEQDQYDEMHDYLSQDMPGMSLTVLAMILWVLTISVEFRAVWEQGTAILHLPTHADSAAGRRASIVKLDTGYQVVGMRRSRKLMISIFLVLPRLGITIALALIGCQYLAQTLSLHDIVLNSVALAFVMEVDEFVAKVLLPRKLKGTIERTKPIESGKPWKVGACHMPDLIRYVVFSGLVIFSIMHWLLPFHSSVQAAAMALCAGDMGFVQTGGNANLSTVIILETQNFTSTYSKSLCENKYLPKYYPGFNASGQNKALPEQSSLEKYTSEELQQARLRTALQYAFNGCPSGQVKGLKGRCTMVCDRFQRSFRQVTGGAEVGGNIHMPLCKGFDHKLGAAACSATEPMQNCSWPWPRYACEEGTPPGLLYSKACPADVIEYTALSESCKVWEDTFRKQHPFVDCDIVDICRTERTTDCRWLVGHLALTVRNVHNYEADRQTTQEAIASGLSTALGVDRSTVVILQVQGWPVNALVKTEWGLKLPQPRMLGHLPWMNTWWGETGPKVDNDNVSLVRFGVKRLPATLLLRSIPGRIATMAEWMNNATNLGNGCLTSVKFQQIWIGTKPR